jgi:hypothetical protein
VQEWHGERGTSTGKFRARKIVDPGVNWPLPEWWWPAVQKWHDTGKTGFRDKENMTLHWEPGKDGTEDRRWKGPEWKNGIRDRGQRQQLRGKIRIKDLGSGWRQYL